MRVLLAITLLLTSCATAKVVRLDYDPVKGGVIRRVGRSIADYRIEDGKRETAKLIEQHCGPGAAHKIVSEVATGRSGTDVTFICQ
jgi:hypothetical protein